MNPILELMSRGWKVKIKKGELELVAPNFEQAKEYATQQIEALALCAATYAKPHTIVRYPTTKEAKRGYFKIGAYLAPASLIAECSHSSICMAQDPPSPPPRRGLDEAARQQISAWGADRIAIDASPDAVRDFIAGQEAAGNIVTIMSHAGPHHDRSDQFLQVNHQQVAVRAGGWTIYEWIQTNSRSMIWSPSFWRGSRNYYEELYDGLPIDSGRQYVSLPGFDYQVMQPDGGIWRCITHYHLTHYCGELVRIGVSPTDENSYQCVKKAEAVQDYRKFLAAGENR